jgi:hypothetical protein
MTIAPPSHPSAGTDRAVLGRGADLTMRVLGAILLATSAYTHLHLASLYDFGPPVTMGQLFLAQGVVAGVLALWLLLRGDRASWVLAGLLMAASAAAVLVSAHTAIPAVGPFPSIYEPVWYPEKVVSAAAEVAFVVLALGRAGGMVLARRR